MTEATAQETPESIQMPELSLDLGAAGVPEEGPAPDETEVKVKKKRAPASKKDKGRLTTELLTAGAGKSGLELITELLTTVTNLHVKWSSFSQQLPFIPGRTIKEVTPTIIDTVVGIKAMETLQVRRPKLMVIQAYPNVKAVHGDYGTPELCGQLLDVLRPLVGELGVEDVWLTHAVRFFPGEQIRSQYKTISRGVLIHEIRMVKPEKILILGSAGVPVLFGATIGIKATRANEAIEFEGIPVYTSVGPDDLLKKPATQLIWEADVKRIISWIRTGTVMVEEPAHKTYKYLTTLAEVKSAVDLVMSRNARATNFWIGADCEWGNNTGKEGADDVLRCIQFSDRAHWSFVVHLTSEGLTQVIPKEDWEDVYKEVSRIFCDPRCMLAGQNFRSDLKHLVPLGIDCVRNFKFDTLMAYHYYKPQAESVALEYIAAEFTDLGRYDLEVEAWKKTTRSAKDIEMYGYANIPDSVLLPYSAKDADAIMQILGPLMTKLAGNALSPQFAGHEVSGTVVNTQLDMYFALFKSEYAILEGEMDGLPTDYPRMLRMQKLFAKKRNELIADVREAFKWPEFNVDSGDEFRELVYGRSWGKKGVGISPETAIILNMPPVLTTGKYPKPWDELDDDDLETAKPSCNGDALDILKNRFPEQAAALTLLMDLRAVGQVTKNFLPEPSGMDGNGEPTWDSGWLGACKNSGWGDFRVQSNFLATTETFRYRSFKVNVNNLSAGADIYLREVFSPDRPRLLKKKGWQDSGLPELKEEGLVVPELFPLRSFIRARPGDLLVENDYSQAEVVAIAGLSGEDKLLDAVLDPNKDVHAMTACMAFQLNPPADVTDHKKWLKDNGHSHYRSAAKSVLFGILYQRGAGGIQRQLMAAGLDVTFDDCQKMIDDVYAAYPKVRSYVELQKWYVDNRGYVENPYGMRRYFFPTKSRSVMSAQKRAAVNFPIQSSVAGLLQSAYVNMWQARIDHGLNFRFVIPFHDAGYLAIPVNEVEATIPVVYKAMSEDARIPGVGPGGLGLCVPVDHTYYCHWSEKGTLSELIQQSLDSV